MSSHLLLVLTDAVEGREDEYNDWYTNRHAPDVLALEGVLSAQRFRLEDPKPGSGEGPPQHRYLSVFEVAEGQLEQARDALVATRTERAEAEAAGREPRVPVSPALAGPRTVLWATAITDQLRKD